MSRSFMMLLLRFSKDESTGKEEKDFVLRGRESSITIITFSLNPLVFHKTSRFLAYQI